MPSSDPSQPEHAPLRPARPQYGEYASPEHAARAAELEEERRRQTRAVPAAATAAAATAAQPTPTDSRTTTASAAGVAHSTSASNPHDQTAETIERPVNFGDVIASILLLGVAVFMTLATVLNAFDIEAQMNALYAQAGASGSYTPGSAQTIAAAVLIISHVGLLGLATVVTAGRLRRHRLSFWVPLVAGAVAGIIFFGTMMVLIFMDPALVDALVAATQ